MALQNIKKDGFYEGIFKNRCNVVTEGTISNLFFTKKDKLYTPALRLNILPGIVRQKVIEIANKRGVKVEEGEYNEEEILGADSIFITNSLMKNGILWVSEIEGIKKAKGKIEELIEVEYGKIIKD
jgi:4-amino-4-deoxychorismate lyase